MAEEIRETEEKKETIKIPRNRTMEILYKPVFDVGLNMAVDYYTRVVLTDYKVGFIQPETYIPVAEKSNQIAEIGKWAIEEACDAIIRERDRTMPDCTRAAEYKKYYNIYTNLYSGLKDSCQKLADC